MSDEPRLSAAMPGCTCTLDYDPVHKSYVCSSCGVWLATCTYRAQTWCNQFYEMRFRFCPNCGARVVVCDAD